MSINRRIIDGFQLGQLRVKTGESIQINGFVLGDVFVEAGAVLKVDCFIVGNIVNQGGQVNVNGFVRGRRSDSAIDAARRLPCLEHDKSLSSKLMRLISRK